MPVISIKIKSSGDKKYEVQVDTESSIEDLKTIIAAEADIPVESQRLIYSGKVLKDTETVAFYKIQNDHSIHLVKSAAAKAKTPQSSGPGSSAAAGAGAASGLSGAADSSNSSPSSAAGAVPSNIAAGQGFNPLSDLTGARYAGYTQLPNASMFGPDGGMGAFPDPEQIDSLMSNPEFQSHMNAMLSDPRMLDMLIDQSPQLRGLSPEARQMLHPMFREMLSNPESIRSMMTLNRQMQSGGFGGAGANASSSAFPAPGSNPTVEGVEAPADSQGTGSNANAAANPFANMFRNGVPPFDPSLFGALGGNQQAPADNRPPEEKYEDQLRQLNEMGFSDFDQNVAALRRSGGNVQGALDFLLSGGF